MEKTILLKPQAFEDTSKVADYLKQQKAVILNLEDLDAALSRRFTDFLNGVAYANKSQIQRKSDRLFIITPPCEMSDGV